MSIINLLFRSPLFPAVRSPVVGDPDEGNRDENDEKWDEFGVHCVQLYMDTNYCTNSQGYCQIDHVGAFCKCYPGFAGNHCEYECKGIYTTKLKWTNHYYKLSRELLLLLWLAIANLQAKMSVQFSDIFILYLWSWIFFCSFCFSNLACIPTRFIHFIYLLALFFIIFFKQNSHVVLKQYYEMWRNMIKITFHFFHKIMKWPCGLTVY